MAFIDQLRILCIEDSKITDEMTDKVIKIKQLYWDYSQEEHKMWLQMNINDNEYHLIITGSNEEVIAYLNIVRTSITYNGVNEEVMGVGNVCVDKKYSGQGIGQLLMSACNYYLNSFNKRAILMCKSNLISFYEKSGWKKHNGQVYLKGTDFQGAVMFNKPIGNFEILIERNF